MTLTAEPRRNQAAIGSGSLPNALAAYVPALREADDEFRLRLLLHDFGLVWQDATAGERTRLIAEEPALFNTRWDAFVAAYAEHLATASGLTPPPWSLAPQRHLRTFWYAGGCYDWDRARTVVTTPGAFESHGIWFPRSELTVV